MKIDMLNCPTCGSPLDADIRPNKPFNCPACGSAVVLTDWTKAGQLICAKCGTVNGSTNKFCDSCGTALQAGCPFCYTQNDVSAINCKKCGANLQRAWQRQDSWFTQREQKHKETLQKVAEGQADYLRRLLLQLNEPENHPAAIPGIRIFGREAVEPLMDLLTSEDPDARFGAAKALGDIGDKRAIPGLINTLNDPEGAVRFWALDALGKLKADEAAEAIGKLVQDKRESIRDLAKEVLTQIGTPNAMRVLKQQSKRKWW
jgi:transcription initiation factor TFIIIB Brf1 subunit/transcription initiation factor TFIIB